MAASTSTPYRTPNKSSDHHHRQPLLYRDLSSPFPSSGATPHRFFSTPSPSPHPISALHRHTPSPPPPPLLSLDDLPSPSPDSPLPFLSATPPPAKSQPEILSRFSPEANGVDRGTGLGSGSPVEGVVHPSASHRALITLPPPREVVRPEIPKNSSSPVWELDEEVWVTVYGFTPSDTNLVLREFEKCGGILKWVPGPKEANWMHILYQSRYDAQKALAKHGQQLNNLLILGVKQVDPFQCRCLNDNFSESAPSPLPLTTVSPVSAKSMQSVSPLPQISFSLQNNVATDTTRNASGTIASPTKSVVSRVLDLMFGI
ncbi:nuclear pore complex protein NUP35-like [Carex rostrata]